MGVRGTPIPPSPTDAAPVARGAVTALTVLVLGCRDGVGEHAVERRGFSPWRVLLGKATVSEHADGDEPEAPYESRETVSTIRQSFS